MKNRECNEKNNGLFGKKTSMVLAFASGALIVGVPFVAPALAGPLNSDSLIDPDFENAIRKHVEKRFFNLIEATEAQRTQLDDLFKTRCEANRSTREQVKEAAIQVAKLMAEDSATDDQIKSKVQDIRKLREQLADSRLDTALKVRSILTKEQRKIVSDRVIGFISGNQRHLLLRSMM